MSERRKQTQHWPALHEAADKADADAQPLADAVEAEAVAEFKARFFDQAIPNGLRRREVLSRRPSLGVLLGLIDEMEGEISLLLGGLGQKAADEWMDRLVARGSEGWKQFLALRKANKERAELVIAAHAERAKRSA